MMLEIIIPNYNGFSLIKKNLPQVIKVMSVYKDWSITIVDDNSEQNDFEKLESLVNDLEKKAELVIQLIRNNQNLGFSSTVNRAAFESQADLLVFLNSDVVPSPRFLDKVLKDFEKDENLFGVGCMDKSVENGKEILRGRGIGKWQRGFLMHFRGEVNKKNTLWVSGGSSVVRRDLFVKMRGFDTLYNPFYWEDIDLSFRAQKMGYDVMFEKESVVVHEHFEGAIKTHYSESEIKKISYKNQFVFVWKNITDADFVLSHALYLPYHFLKAAMRFDFAFFQGFFLALIQFPAIIGNRLKQKKDFVKTDKSILNQFI